VSLRLPCMTCDQPAAEAARREVVETYLAARSGRLPPKLRGSSTLPWTCCKRPKEPRRIDVEAVIASARRS